MHSTKLFTGRAGLPAHLLLPVNNAPKCRRRQWRQGYQAEAGLRPLIIDNYDSYTYNLYQIVAEVYGVKPLVMYNDGADINHILHMLETGQVHHIILSPGPGSPVVPSDIGVCWDILQEATSTPLLGVCLGHQALAAAVGARVVRAPEPVHGRLSKVRHTGHQLFQGCPSGELSDFGVVRYHSLVVEANGLPEQLEPLAWTCGTHQPVALQPRQGLPAMAAPIEAGAGARQRAKQKPQKWHMQQGIDQQQPQAAQELLMALRHTQRPHYGVQFHPESVATCYGVQVLLNFRDLAYAHSGHQVPAHLPASSPAVMGPPGRSSPPRPWPTPHCLLPGSWQIAAGVEDVHPWQQQQQHDVTAQHQEKCMHQHQQHNQHPWQQQQTHASGHMAHATALSPAAICPSGLQLVWQRLPGVLQHAGGSQQLFEGLVGPRPDTFWLDSSSGPERARFSFMGGSGGPMWHRIMYKLPPPAQPCVGPDSNRGSQLEEQQQQPPWQHQSHHVPSIDSSNGHQLGSLQPGLVTISSASGLQQHVRMSVWDYLQEQLHQLQLLPECAAAAAEQLPFNFWGGFVGYFGYELKAESGGRNAHAASGPDAAWQFVDRLLVCDHQQGDVYLLALHPACADSAVSLAVHSLAAAAHQWLQDTADLVHRLIAAAEAQQLHPSISSPCGSRAAVVAAAAVLAEAEPTVSVEQESQMSDVTAAAAVCRDNSSYHQSGSKQQQHTSIGSVQHPQVVLRHDRQAYVANVAACKEALVAGESYELCLTTSYQLQQLPDPWLYYKTLRSINPAPYAAWLCFAGSEHNQNWNCSSGAGSRASTDGRHERKACEECSASASFDTNYVHNAAFSSASSRGGITVCCSSPERFLQGGRGGLLEAKPIKGTARRDPTNPLNDAALAAALAGSEKERAENLMIVDLLRNDLGKVCEPGSVHVPGLIQLESYATVHQLVSTVRGLRRADASCIDAIRAAFPGGSMTGAPKIRSMDILDRLEGGARGVYSGALGYLSVNDTFDLNIVIRSAVFADVPSSTDYHSSSNASQLQQQQQRQQEHSQHSQMVMSVGAGGAIVMQGDAHAEFAEMQLKADRLIQAAALTLSEQHGH